MLDVYDRMIECLSCVWFDIGSCVDNAFEPGIPFCERQTQNHCFTLETEMLFGPGIFRLIACARLTKSAIFKLINEVFDKMSLIS